jgi:hypothetical protein
MSVMLDDATDPLGVFVVVDLPALRLLPAIDALWLGSRLSTVFCDFVLNYRN